MGIAVPSQLFGRQHLILSTMKAFAAAEAKPWLGYGAAVVPIDPHATSGELVTIGDAQVPDTTLSVKAAAADHLAAKSLHYGAYGLYGGYGLGYAAVPACIDGVAPIGHGLCKREADAWYGYGGLYGYSGLGLGYGGYGYGGLYGYGKKSADAEAKPEADAWYGYGGLYGYGVPAYGGYGYGLGYGYGKRSADAKPEADAWYGYGGLYGYGLPVYGGYGYGLW